MRLCINWISNPITSRVRNRHFFFFHCVFTSYAHYQWTTVQGAQARRVLPTLPQGMGGWCWLLPVQSAHSTDCFSLILLHLCNYPRAKCTLSPFNRWGDSWIKWLAHCHHGQIGSGEARMWNQEAFFGHQTPSSKPHKFLDHCNHHVAPTHTLRTHRGRCSPCLQALSYNVVEHMIQKMLTSLTVH